MKTIICQKPYRFELADTETPARTESEALVRIRRIGICGTDLHAYEGNQPFFTYPRILGHELSGIVAEIGDNRHGLKNGDQVAVIPYLECGECIACRNGKPNCCMRLCVLGVHADGGMREFMPVPADHLIKTEGISLDHAALLEPLSIGAHAVRRSEVKAGEWALVIGAGPIGLGVMAFAKQNGAKVIAMDINRERLDFCKSWMNADAVVDALHEPAEQLAQITNGEFPAVVFDATGNARSMADAFGYAAHGGKLVFVGLFKGDIAFSDPEFHKRELTLMSSRNATREDFARVIQTVKSGAVDLDRYITHRCAFENMTDEFASWLRPETRVIKAMVELNGWEESV